MSEDKSEDVTLVQRKPGRGKRARGKTGSKMLTLHYVRSQICAPKDQKATVRGLGFTRLGQKIQRPDDPSIRVLRVTPTEAEYWDSPGTIRSYIRMAAAAVSDTRPAMGDHEHVRMEAAASD